MDFKIAFPKISIGLVDYHQNQEKHIGQPLILMQTDRPAALLSCSHCSEAEACGPEKYTHCESQLVNQNYFSRIKNQCNKVAGWTFWLFGRLSTLTESSVKVAL